MVADVSVPCYIWRLSNASKGLIYGTLVSVPCYIWRLSNIGMSWANTNVVSVPCYIWRLSNLISRHHKHGQAPSLSFRRFQQSHLMFSLSDGLWIDLNYSIANFAPFSNSHGSHGKERPGLIVLKLSPQNCKKTFVIVFRDQSTSRTFLVIILLSNILEMLLFQNAWYPTIL